jgi:hypothetical protein
MQTFCSALALHNSLFWYSTGMLPTVLPSHLKIMGLILCKVTTFSAHVQVGGAAFFTALPKICTETHSGATEIRYLISGRDRNLHTDASQWRYLNSLPNISQRPKFAQGIGRFGATFSTCPVLKCATQSATQRRYQQTPGIQEGQANNFLDS